jgi:transcriptional regulator GlxA family with amidase domain
VVEFLTEETAVLLVVDLSSACGGTYSAFVEGLLDGQQEILHWRMLCLVSTQLAVPSLVLELVD